MLRAVFSQAIERGYLRSNPVEGASLNARARDTQPYSKEEIERMLSGPIRKARPDLRAILLTFLTTGFRISDVEGLEKREVDFIWNRIIRRTLKRGKVVSLPLHPELRAEMETPRKQTPEQKASPPVFHTRSGKRMRKLDSILRAHFRRCGITGGHAHRFRDTFSVGILGQGGSLYDVARLLGTTVAVAEHHYAPYAQELQDRGYRLVMGLPFTQSTGHKTRTPVAQPEHSAAFQASK